MAKDRERKHAFDLYMKGRLGKEIAQLVGTTEKTISTWVLKYNWKTRRDATINNSRGRIDNIKAILSDLADETININNRINDVMKNGTDITIGKGKDAIVITKREQLKELRAGRNKLADEAAKWNKTLENLDKESKISFSTYIQIFEDVFRALREYDQRLYMKTIDFQEEHLQNKANLYK